MDMQAAIRALTELRDLTAEEMAQVMGQIMSGQATPAQIGGFLIGLRMKGETVEEIAAAAQVMSSLATRVEVHASPLVDIVGTGGDGRATFNISTACIFVVAAAGGKVAKHGNRSVSSRSGSADVLEAAGVRLDISPARVARCVEEIGVGFMFAPRHHSAMKHAVGPRREMGVRTLFNLLGPLTNPAGALHLLLGVFAEQWVEPMAQVLARLGARRALVVHAEDGIDEISIGAPTRVAELSDGAVHRYVLTPERFGLVRADVAELIVEDPQHSLEMVLSVLDNAPGPARDIVALNAGAAIYVADLVASLEEGVARAKAVISSGAAREKLDQLRRCTQIDA
jgi:anthranilate phosphoribosyltransferase